MVGRYSRSTIPHVLWMRPLTQTRNNGAGTGHRSPGCIAFRIVGGQIFLMGKSCTPLNNFLACLSYLFAVGSGASVWRALSGLPCFRRCAGGAGASRAAFYSSARASLGPVRCSYPARLCIWHVVTRPDIHLSSALLRYVKPLSQPRFIWTKQLKPEKSPCSQIMAHMGGYRCECLRTVIELRFDVLRS